MCFLRATDGGNISVQTCCTEIFLLQKPVNPDGGQGRFREGLVNSWCIVGRDNYTPTSALNMRVIDVLVYSLREKMGYKIRNVRTYARGCLCMRGLPCVLVQVGEQVLETK